jgi:hypothetical protein
MNYLTEKEEKELIRLNRILINLDFLYNKKKIDEKEYIKKNEMVNLGIEKIIKQVDLRIFGEERKR